MFLVKSKHWVLAKKSFFCVFMSFLAEFPFESFFFSESKLCAAATKLPLLPLSTLQVKFDNEKEFCNMTDRDFVQLSQLFGFGIKFLHGGMLPIFDALVYLSYIIIIFNQINRFIEIWFIIIIPIGLIKLIHHNINQEVTYRLVWHYQF